MIDFDIEHPPNLSEQVANGLRDRIYDGRLAGGERINEVHLAAQLGVSRTCIREALGKLVAEDALISVPRRGCFVRELTVKEFEDIYPIRALLDPEALRLSGVPTAAALERLERINGRIRAAKDIETRMTLDDEWHLQLVAGCDNDVLLGLITHFMRRFRRYGLAFGRDASVLQEAGREHLAILEALRDGDMASACDWLRRNLSSNKAPILEWLESRASVAARSA